jgi:glycosyltransferase involved in cell wall biosynthesis
MLVSTLMTAYNHGKYIKASIEGILSQVANFEIELIIADDCSSDNTFQEVTELTKNHPKGKWIKYTKHPENIGMIANLKWTIQNCKGKYIALCEGDDYWTDPLKLQKQINFLESNKDFSICYHKVQILKNDKLEDDFITTDKEQITGFKDLCEGNFMHTPSVVFVNNFDKGHFLRDCNDMILGDYYLHLFNAQFGKIFRINEVMAVYRFGGLWSNNNNSEFKKIITTHTYKQIVKDFTPHLNLIQKYYLTLIQTGKTNVKFKVHTSSDFDKKLLNLFESKSLTENASMKNLITAIILKLLQKLKLIKK